MPDIKVSTPPSLEKRPFRRFFSNLGPGLITGAADDEPSGISTYSVAGATFGYLPLWTALFSFPLMTAVQLMCARLGSPANGQEARRVVTTGPSPSTTQAKGTQTKAHAKGKKHRKHHKASANPTTTKR